MKLEFSKDYYLRLSDFDRFSNIKPSAVLDLFQDIAALHAEMTGAGFNDLDKKGLLWVVARTKIYIDKMPQKYSDVKIKTWPLYPKGIICRREYLMTDALGETLIRGSSDWIVIDKSTRKPVRPVGIYPENCEFVEDMATDPKLKRITPDENIIKSVKCTPGFCETDANGHINNIKYADLALNAMAPEKSNYISFGIDYHSEVMPYEEISLEVSKKENTYFINGISSLSERAFTCEIKF